MEQLLLLSGFFFLVTIQRSLETGRRTRDAENGMSEEQRAAGGTKATLTVCQR